jgi:hypothetical protein
MGSSLPLLAGTVSMVVFACSALPMLRAWAADMTDLASSASGTSSWPTSAALSIIEQAGPGESPSRDTSK